MKNTKNKFYTISLLALLSIIGMAVLSCTQAEENRINGDGDLPEVKIINFEQCVAAGNGIMKSKPAQCSANGETFVEETNANNNPLDPNDVVQIDCTQEAKQCPDGSYVSRTEPNCEFAKCPGNSDSRTICTMDVKECPDGSYVTRKGPNCEFALCPA